MQPVPPAPQAGLPRSQPKDEPQKSQMRDVIREANQSLLLHAPPSPTPSRWLNT